MDVCIVEEWNNLFDAFETEDIDIYYREEYVKLINGHNAKCAICREGTNILILPFIRSEYKGYFDFETPYGYGGPIANTKNSVWIENALRELEKYLFNNKYIAGFVRFHPLLKNSKMCGNVFNIFLDRKTVSIKTDNSIKEIWEKQISSKNRNMIRKAEKNELVFTLDEKFENIDKFKEIYNLTMSRLNASSMYFFNQDYYDNFKGNLKNYSFLAYVTKGDEIISSALFMFYNNLGHYHLAGSERSINVGANNFLLWNVTNIMHEKGIKEFHLGGGTSSDVQDSLFKFKESFSHNLNDFYLGKWVINKEIYSQFCNEWELANPEKKNNYKNYFLKYRC